MHFDAGYRSDRAWGFEGLWDFHDVGAGKGFFDLIVGLFFKKRGFALVDAN